MQDTDRQDTDRTKRERQQPAAVEDEPFLIDPGNEDPGAGIDQVLPVSTPAQDEPASES